MIRLLTSGESHGKALAVIIDGVPAGLSLSVSDINPELRRRQEGYGRGGRMVIERDTVEILSGIRNGITTGAPVTLLIANADSKNWENKTVPPVTMPRPGHADLAGVLKYGLSDIRDVLERASARETAARVAAGAVCRKLLKEFGIEIFGYVTQIADIQAKTYDIKYKAVIEASPLRTADKKAEKAMITVIEKAKKNGDSIGGVFEVRALKVPAGLGSYAQWDKKLDARLAGGLMSLQAIKGVEIGLGFKAAQMPGSKVHDQIYYKKGMYYRKTNSCGGIEGGMSNGSDIVVRAAMKPIATLYKPLNSIDIVTKKKVKALVERSDTCAVPAACVAGEAIVAFEIANCFMEKFGGDAVIDINVSLNAYLKRIKGL
ncbi:MAG: chorismate synthase [Candidatus Firestonebacteria bacterium]